MHDLFLGSGKHILKDVWITLGLISDSQFDLIQDRTDRIICPPDIGRIPNKIKSGFSSFTADQYKNWIVYFSLLSLRDILFGSDLECWRHFMLACRYLCSREITLDQIKIVDTLLLQFCKRIERMYGKEIITPNMHLHAHLYECLLDYGPSHVTWLLLTKSNTILYGSIYTVRNCLYSLLQSPIVSYSLPSLLQSPIVSCSLP